MADIISSAGLDGVERVTRSHGITPQTGLELIRMLRESQSVIREAVKQLDALSHVQPHYRSQSWWRDKACGVRDLLAALEGRK
jgi:hypothetical protein